jgi:hypothetical protein
MGLAEGGNAVQKYKATYRSVNLMQTSEPDVRQAYERAASSGAERRNVAEQMHNVRLQTLQHEVACAAITGVPCEEINERVIDTSPVSDEVKAALRLYSWSFLSRFELRRMALDRLLNLSWEEPADESRMA